MIIGTIGVMKFELDISDTFCYNDTLITNNFIMDVEQ